MCPQIRASHGRYFKLKISSCGGPPRGWTSPRARAIMRSSQVCRDGTMKRYQTLILASALGLAAPAAQAQEKLKIGVIATLSGPPAVLGQQLRNGVQLAVKSLGGKFGGREVELIVQDDELKPDVAVTKVKAMIERDKVDFVIGPIFPNV